MGTHELPICFALPFPAFLGCLGYQHRSLAGLCALAFCSCCLSFPSLTVLFPEPELLLVLCLQTLCGCVLPSGWHLHSEEWCGAHFPASIQPTFHLSLSTAGPSCSLNHGCHLRVLLPLKNAILFPECPSLLSSSPSR